MVSASRLEEAPARTFSGQTATIGTRIPPSYISRFPTPQVPAVGFRPQVPSVVAGEQDQGFAVLPVFPESLHHLPDPLVQVFDEGRQPGPASSLSPPPRWATRSRKNGGGWAGAWGAL